MGATARSDGKVVRLAHTGSDGRLDRCWTSYGTKCPNPDPGGKVTAGRFKVEEVSCFPVEATSTCPGAASSVSPCCLCDCGTFTCMLGGSLKEGEGAILDNSRPIRK